MSDITVYVTSDLTSSERKVSPQWTIKYFKEKLELITGIEPIYQTIQLYAGSNSNEYKILSDASGYSAANDSETTIASYGLRPYCRIHVIDTNPNLDLKDLADETPINEYQMSEEEYAKRSNTVLAWKEQNKLGRFDPKYELERKRQQDLEEKLIQTIKIGSRCRVMSIQGERRGSVRFVGKISQLDDGESYWVGVEFDEPVGKNNGSIGSLQLFHCRDNHGSFVKPQKVEIGDFPEIDPFASDEEL